MLLVISAASSLRLAAVFNLDYYIMPKPGKLLLFGSDKFSTDAGPL
jgi:hypothetical protein